MVRIVFIAILLSFLGTKVHGQQDTCLSNALRSDTLIVWFHDKAIFQPDKRKIEITQFHKRWYRVSYEDSDGHVSKRRIHRHRIKKFMRKLTKIHSHSHTPTGGYIESGITDMHCTTLNQVALDHKKKCYQAMHVLKIWPKEKNQK